MKKKNSKKVIFITLLVIVLIAGTVLAVLAGTKNKKPVYVYSFYDDIVGHTNIYGMDNESEGFVSTDHIQPVHLTDSQTVLEIKVSEGQRVSKGDVLFTYDTTLSEISLKQKELAIQRLKLDLDAAKQELSVINGYIPMPEKPAEPPETTEPADQQGSLQEFDLEGKPYLIYAGTGATPLDPKYCWLRSGTMIDEPLMADLFKGTDNNLIYVRFQLTEGDTNVGAVTEEYGVKLMRVLQNAEPASAAENPQVEPDSTEATDTTEVTEPTEVPTEPPVTTAVFIYRYSFYDPEKVNLEPILPEQPAEPENSGYTAAEISAMKTEKKRQIKDMEFQIKVSEGEYKIMQMEAASGQVEAEFDGVVMDVREPDTARKNGEPLLKVSGGGGYYIWGKVSELDLDSVQIGQVVEINSWETGEICQGEIVELQEFPQKDSNNYFNNADNISYYPYKVFVDGSANLRNGMYVSMKLQSGEQDSNLYIENAFVMKEGSSSFVYARNEDGRLEKRKIAIGGKQFNDCIQVLGGVTADDWLAFPYDKNAKEGALVQEGSWDTLYGM